MEGAWGWAGLGVYVLAYDTWACLAGRETLSGSFLRAWKHPLHRWPVLTVWAVTSLHLYGRLPPRLDPFGGYAAILRRRN